MGYHLSLVVGDELVRSYAASLAQFVEKQTEIYIAGLRNALAFLAANPRAARLRTEMQRPARIRHAHEDWINGRDDSLD
jgi:plasmid stabilization system protein ParE